MKCVNTLYETRYSNYFVGICPKTAPSNNNNNNRRLVTLAEHTSDHGRQTNSSTEEKGGKKHLVKVLLFANILIGPAYPGQFASKISIISTFIVI